VEFYSDHCPFCKSLAPELLKAAKASRETHGDKVHFGALNSRIFGKVAERFNITGYPWVACFYQGAKTNDMTGLGGADSVINWANAMVSEHQPSGEVEYLRGVTPESAPEGGEGEAEAQHNFTEEELIYGGLNASGTLGWRETLGQHSWFFLHTVAAKYAEHPTEADQQAVRYLYASLGQHYPCKACRHKLQQLLRGEGGLGPIRTKSRKDLSVWTCELHNAFNQELGKPQFDCNPFKLDLIYLKDCGECKLDPKTGEIYGGTGGIWNAELWAKDPADYRDIKSQAEMWKKEELEELLTKATDYNILPAKKVKKIREAIQEKEITEEEAIQNLAEKLAPVLKLESKVRRLERG